MTSPVVLTAAALVLAVLAMMALEAQLSAHNERTLRARGAVEPPEDVIGLMRIAYPLGFLVIGAAGALNAALGRERILWGLAVLTVAKALKFWAITTLGVRWSFRVLVLPGAPLVSAGPYRYVRHPNYLAVLGEYAGVAIALWAPVTGAMVMVLFGWLMWRRVRVEERALGIRSS
jgi:methyltransferase